MDHKALVSSLDPEVRATLTRASNARGLMNLAGHWGAIVAVGALILLRVPLWPALLAAQGVLLAFLFTPLHETTHRTPFRTGWINDVVGHVCGFLLFLPATWFRCFHLAHHRFTQIPGKDPELDAAKPETWRQYLLHLSALPVWRSQLRTLVRNAAGRCNDGFVPEGRRGSVTREARLMLAGYGALAGLSALAASPALLLVWIVPLLLGQPALRLYLLAEHGRCAFVTNMLENSRTTFSNTAVRWLAWNMPYHAEHHSFPTVPFHRLPDLHRLIAPHLAETEAGYAAFHRRYAPRMARPAES